MAFGQELDSSQFVEVDPSAPAGSPAAPVGKQLTGDFEEMPSYANGMSPDSPINKSPVDLVDRLRFSLGNKAGVIKDLQKKFEAVEQDQKGNLLVKSQGLWHRVDPKGLGDGDPWERTKELIGDTADLVPQVAKNSVTGAVMGGVPGAIIGGVGTVAADAYGDEIGGFIQDHALALGIPAAAIAGVGVVKGGILKAAGAASAATQGAGEMIRTSFGRAVGTYEGDTVDQVMDSSKEALMTVFGNYFAAGVKPTAQMIGQAVRTTGQMLKDAPATNRAIAVNIFGKLGDMGPANMENWVENYGKLGAMSQKYVEKAGSTGGAIQELTKDQVSNMKSAANQVQTELSTEWRKMGAIVERSVGEDFVGSSKEIAHSGFTKMEEMGLGSVVKDTEGAVKGFKLHSDDVLATQVKALEEAGHAEQADVVRSIMSDGKNKEYVNDLVEALRRQSRVGDIKGPAGARSIISLKKNLNEVINSLEERAKDESANGVLKLLGIVDNHIDQTALSKFEPPIGSGKVNPYKMMLSSYGQMKSKANYVLDAAKAARKQNSDQPFLTLLNQVTGETKAATLKSLQVRNLSEMTNPMTGQKVFTDAVKAPLQNIVDMETVKSVLPMTGSSKGGSWLSKTIAPVKDVVASPRLLAGTAKYGAEQANYVQPYIDGAKQRVSQAIQQMGDTSGGNLIKDMLRHGLDFTQSAAKTGVAKRLGQDSTAFKAFTNSLIQGFTTTNQVRDGLLQEAAQKVGP